MGYNPDVTTGYNKDVTTGYNNSNCLIGPDELPWNQDELKCGNR